jgi:hypothetical protein
VTNITGTAALISWVTSETSNGQVLYGQSPSYGLTTALNVELTTSHAETLTGLTPSTVYHYSIRSGDASGNYGESGDLTFTTGGSLDGTPPVLSEIAVTGISNSGATISWKTNEAADAQVEYARRPPTAARSSSTRNRRSPTNSP